MFSCSYSGKDFVNANLFPYSELVHCCKLTPSPKSLVCTVYGNHFVGSIAGGIIMLFFFFFLGLGLWLCMGFGFLVGDWGMLICGVVLMVIVSFSPSLMAWTSSAMAAW